MGKINVIRFFDEFKERNNVISLNGKNLIITGENGSGKTRFLKKLHERLELTASSNSYSMSSEQYHDMIQSNQMFLNNPENPDPKYTQRLIISYQDILASLNEFEIIMSNWAEFCHRMRTRHSYLCFFSATRMSNIINDGKISSKKSFDAEYEHLIADDNFDSGVLIEKYLVTILVHSLLNQAIDGLDGVDWIKGLGKVGEIIDIVTKDLRFLFEDDSLKLHFDLAEFKIKLYQDGKGAFGFDCLSSGYSSILSIYANLFVRMQKLRLPKEEFSGIVIIDEIDVHLHVSLQKIIFPFLNKSFPNVQFIVSTHSPFVIQSVSDAVIYNMSSNEQMSDLSFYSYSTIVKGLLGEGAASDQLTVLVNELLELTNNNNFNERFDELVKMIEKDKEHLDPRSRVSLALAQSKKMDSEE